MAKKKQFAILGPGRFGKSMALTMLVGRVGIMTFMLALITQKNSVVKYPPEDVMVG